MVMVSGGVIAHFLDSPPVGFDRRAANLSAPGGAGSHGRISVLYRLEKFAFPGKTITSSLPVLRPGSFSVLSFLRNAEYRHPIRFWQKEHAYSPYNLENLHNYLYALSQKGMTGRSRIFSPIWIGISSKRRTTPSIRGASML
jgi:hypothetical protein